MEANPERLARALHPDLAKRAVIGDTPYERFGLRRMSKEELVGLTENGALKTPTKDWSGRCDVIDCPRGSIGLGISISGGSRLKQ